MSHSAGSALGAETRIIDARLLRMSPESVVSEAAKFTPDLVGVTAMTFEAPWALELISLFKDRRPDLPVVIGGPHATGYGPSLLESCRADYLVTGEGEESLVELLETMRDNGDPGTVKGLAWRDGDKVVYNGPREPCRDLDRLGVDWEGVGPERYFGFWRRNAMNTVARSSRRLPVFTSRGCPFGCAYCHSIFGRKYRTFGVGPLVEEMVRLRDRYRLGEFEIIDDNFNVKLDHSKAVMEEVIRRGLNTPLGFANGLRADRMDEELLGLMERAGTYRIDYAIESASPRVQKISHKNLDLERAREVVNATVRRGIVTGTYYMLGFPGETEEEMAQTVEYALSLDNHVASFFYLMPFPGTEFADSDPEFRERARRVAFGDASSIAINLSAVADPKLMRIRRRAYRRFYLNGRRIIRIIRDVPVNPRLFASGLAAIRLSFQDSVNY